MGRPRGKVENWLGYVVFRAFVGIVERLPIRACYAVAVPVGWGGYALAVRHRPRVIRNLLHTGVAADKPTARRLARANFQHFARLIFEVAKIRQLVNPANMRDHLTVAGDPVAVARFFAGPQPAPAIIVGAHSGNWEFAGQGYSVLTGIPLTTVMRPFDNPLIGRRIYQLREGFQHRVVPKEGALKRLWSALRRGESVCFLADQHASSRDGVPCVFFGHPVSAHVAPALLHLRTGVPILPIITRRRPGAMCYELYCHAPISYTPTADRDADTRAVVQLYTTALEQLIRTRPEEWLWAHRRWLDLDRRSAARYARA